MKTVMPSGREPRLVPSDAMEARNTGRRSIVRRYFEAYEYKDQILLESLLADDFTFTSPVDDAINREHYFARCWPNSQHAAAFKIEKLIEDGDDVIVTYLATTTYGTQFTNTEIFSFHGEKIAHVQVFFGCETVAGVSGREISAVVDAWAEGLRRKDVEAVAKHFIGDPVGFYLAPPLVADEDLGTNMREWFDTFDGPLGYEIRDLTIHASGDVGWAHALNHLIGHKTSGEGTDVWFRLTMGFDKIGGDWKIAHAHESVPFPMDGSGKAALDLKPR
jgi:ketosteroid isomerase-like protein